MPFADITHPDSLLHIGSDHPDCPERVSAINAYLLEQGLLDFMVPYTAPAHGRIVSPLEGGYALPALARFAGTHVRVLIGAD
jgi:acetoin utilization deacetylase AcuC-like enzyme